VKTGSAFPIRLCEEQLAEGAKIDHDEGAHHPFHAFHLTEKLFNVGLGGQIIGRRRAQGFNQCIRLPLLEPSFE
jgi:hypothetical protein